MSNHEIGYNLVAQRLIDLRYAKARDNSRMKEYKGQLLWIVSV
jgi:hypothetical protein